jgi:heat shock protein HslJ
MNFLDTGLRLPGLAALRAAWRGVALLILIAMLGALATPAPAAGAWAAQPPEVVGMFWLWQQTQMNDLPADSGTMRFAAPIIWAARQPPETGAADSALLEGTPWALVEYAGADGTTRPVLSGTEVTATFQDGRLAGNAGCNSYGGTYSAAGSALSLSGVAATLRACVAPGMMEQEAAYLAALARVARFAVTPERLTLYDGDGATLLTYVPQAQTPLEGTAWVAQAYNNGRGGVVSLLAGTTITARFEGGRAAGSAGCNSYSAAYTLNGNAIEIGPAAATRRACVAPPGIMEQEAAYLAALATARTYRTEGNRLTLETADGARVASFVAPVGAVAPDAPPSAGSAKLSFDLAPIDAAGLTGPPNGQVAVAYEFCIPATPAYLAEVQRIDATVRPYPSSRGRIGCRPGEEVLCIGSTHQPGWQAVLQQLTALDYVARIDRHFAE